MGWWWVGWAGFWGLICVPHFLLQDYPSVGQVAQALSAANIQPIFAVTSATLPVYQVGTAFPRPMGRELEWESIDLAGARPWV